MHRTNKRSIETSQKPPPTGKQYKRQHHKVRLKSFNLHRIQILSHLIVFVVFLTPSQANRPPRFIIEGQSEIVLRLRESPETEVGKNRENKAKLSIP